MSREDKTFGVVGMAVMGRNLAMNIADRGYDVTVWNRSPEPRAEAVAASGGRLTAAETLAELVGKLERPRRIMLMVKAGKPVDIVLDHLRPLLDEGDIVIDGGNSWFEDTQRRERTMREAGLRFFGVGVSGGEDGARHGPSMMPGGDAEAYRALAPVFEAIAAKTESGPCVTHIGPDGAGHFVKMVHNGIEYADMQLIAEAYALLAGVGGFSPPALAETFGRWNEGVLESFLIEISAKIFTVRDEQSGGWLIDQVLDRAGQKGTGRWTAQVALELAVPIPAIAAAIDARVLSSMKPQRLRASQRLAGPPAPSDPPDGEELAAAVHDALYASKICAYAQGMALIATASEEYGWGVDLREVARIWKGGCIIRARFLDDIMRCYEAKPDLENLLLDDQFASRVAERQRPWRRVATLAQQAGIPVPALSASIAYYDAYRSALLPQNLTQAQRDAFGAHTYQRRDDPEGPFVHTDWI